MPSLIGGQQREYSALPALLAYVILLVAIPSELVVGALGAAGSPANILAIGLMIWWLASRIAAGPGLRPANPIKYLLLAFSCALLLSYISGMSRSLVDVLEVNSADRALLSLVGWCGVALVAMEAIDSRHRLDIVLKTVAVGGTCVAFLGILQFFFKIDLAHLIHIPGLTANTGFGELIARSKFLRVSGTASHPIEFGVVLSAVLPIVLHYARFSLGRQANVRWWVAVVLVAGAIPLSVAKSGLLGGAIVFAVMYFTWPVSFRRRILAGLMAGVLALSVVVPGLLGTFRGLFLNAATDPSTSGRTEDYGPVLEYFRENPVFGRGFGTFIPSLYRTLDNQYLALLVEAGVVGLASTVSLLVGGAVVAIRLRAKSECVRDRDLLQAFTAALAVLSVNAFTFDLFAFSMCVGLTFLLLGCVGATHAISTPWTQSPRLGTVRPRAVIGITFVWLVLVVSIGVVFKSAVPEFQATGSVLLEPPAPVGTPLMNSVGRANMAGSILHDVVGSSASRAFLLQHGVRSFDTALDKGSLMMGTDRVGTSSALIRVVTRASTGSAADEGLKTVIFHMGNELASIQSSIKVPLQERIVIRVLSTDSALLVQGRPFRGFLAGVILSLVFGSFLLHLVRRLAWRSALSVRGVERRGLFHGLFW